MPAHIPALVHIRHLRLLLLAAAVLAAAALAASAAVAPSTSARQTLVHSFVAKDGTTVGSGYDGGVAIAAPGR